ncbi:MAG: tRNA pseudouridine(38-40) synthase TruA [Anaerolineae bacterium]|nr:tRNA pseudouridine(38-40) synthase TruA [Anaerolineae bacterium]
MRVRAIVAYEGTDYHGFQRQAIEPTVQGVLESALAQVTRQQPPVLAAGRTDAGVHAEGQVIAFDVEWRHSLEALQRALNAVLPRDVAVWKTEQAAATFNPRFDAHSRCYRYTIYNAPVRSPLARRTSLHVPRPLDRQAMQEASRCLVGRQDFAAFGRPPQGENSLRRVLRAEWSGELPWLYFDIEADAFLYRMVRSLVGTLLQVGWGKITVEDLARILASRDRECAGPTAPPRGLCLVRVNYKAGNCS